MAAKSSSREKLRGRVWKIPGVIYQRSSPNRDKRAGLAIGMDDRTMSSGERYRDSTGERIVAMREFTRHAPPAADKEDRPLPPRVLRRRSAAGMPAISVRRFAGSGDPNLAPPEPPPKPPRC